MQVFCKLQFLALIKSTALIGYNDTHSKRPLNGCFTGESEETKYKFSSLALSLIIDSDTNHSEVKIEAVRALVFMHLVILSCTFCTIDQSLISDNAYTFSDES